jgi:2-polyprenyl-6-methoxyphenol hydroxylase-like FAD-dependent oxidoreductase
MQSLAAAPRRPPAVSRGPHSTAAVPLVRTPCGRKPLIRRPLMTPTPPSSRAPRRRPAAVTATVAAATTDSTTTTSSLLASASTPAPPGKLRAVVYGGGLAGLAAARILAELFDQVFLLERDALPSDATPGDASSSRSSSPDPAADAAHARRGVPQYRQPHQLLARGLQEIEKLFPGVTADLFSAGAAEVAVPGGYSVFDDRVGHLKHTHASVTLVGSTRALLESVVRARLTKGLEAGEDEAKGAGCRARVEVVSGAVATGWVLEKDQGDAPARVAGVLVRPAGSSSSSSSAESYEIRADLVVDASGRGSKAPEWLEAAGFSAPETTTVSAGTVYLTATYRVPAEALPAPLNPAPGNEAADPAAIALFEAQKKEKREKQQAASAASSSSSSSSSPAPSAPHPGYGIMCYTSFPRTRSSILMPVENGLHQLICCAKMEDLPRVEGAEGGSGNSVATDAGVLAFCDSLPDGGQTARALRAAERVGEITTYRRTENFRRRYEKLVEKSKSGNGAAGGSGSGGGGGNGSGGVPRGWVALGDAAVAFNPVFGQGISVGVLQALKLGELVKEALSKAPTTTSPDPSAARSAAVASVGAPFFAALPSVVEVPWALAAGTDAPFAAGFKQSAGEKLINGYFEGVMRLSADDPGAYDELIATVHMTKPTAALLHPRLALRVLGREVLAGVRRALGMGGKKEEEGGGGSPAAAAEASAPSSAR